ncbi:lipoprotein [Sphingomonas canadensis]|uniref:Type IV secretion system putative lipoprotein virB7 n=1 Tax=Sphingomonas canadensis TaxID=1219257 RepID=A0ABW3H1N1_9SPHN|nr:lipoprotein [Sphingomonas canadensis]MCW3834782.1 lipoprotein [Sphingomonas canadensis]
MKRVIVAAGLAAMLTACSSGGSGSGKDREAGPAGRAAKDAPAPGQASCAHKPAFAPVYAGAAIRHCVEAKDGPGAGSGSMGYAVPVAPATVLAWSRGEIEKGGFKVTLSTDTMMSAADGTSTVAVITTPEGGGSTVILNWGRKK